MSDDRTFPLPPQLRALMKARDDLRDVFGARAVARGASARLRFTLDGNLIGDLGEALAVELFGLTLSEKNGLRGIDGIAPDKRTVQVKATSTRQGPAFRYIETSEAEHLLFFDFDFEQCVGKVVFNGPEDIARRCLPATFTAGQRMVNRARIEAADGEVSEDQRLPMTQPSWDD